MLFFRECFFCKFGFVFISYFLFLYGFSLPIVINSSYIGALLLTLLLLKPSVFAGFYNIIRNRFILYMISVYVFVFIFSLFTAIYNGTYDYSINSTLINNLISIFITCILISYFLTRNEQIEENIYYFLSVIFLSQCMIIILMLLFPTFKEFIQSFIRSDSQLERMSSYNGIRGLGLTGFVAFGFSIMMGVLFPIFCYWIKYYARMMDSLKIVFIILCIISCLSAGRTSILGVLIGLFVLIYSHRANLNYIIRFLKVNFILFFVFMVVFFFIFNNDDIYRVAYYYSRYVFQSIWNYIEYGSFSVNSLEHLDTMYFYPNNLNWFIGNGHYTNDDGTYYMNTDAGYMRFILFFGLIGSLILYSMFLFFSMYIISKTKKPALKILLIMILFSSFIYHYKGEVIMFSVPYMKVYLLVFISSLYSVNLEGDYD